MKKIILIVILFVFSIGYTQTLLQGFEAGGINGGPFGGMPVPVIEAGTGSNTSQVLKFVTDPNIAVAGVEPWQGINLFLSPSTNLTVNKTLTIDVLSSEPITFLVKVTTGGAIAAAPVTHNGDGTWQTLSFTFNTALDNQAANPSGTYSGFVIHPYWEVGRTQFFTPTIVPTPPRTFYVDNIREPALVGPPVNDVTGDVYINDSTFAAGDFTTAAGQDIASNDGSAAEPFATLDYALARSTQAPGDVIYIDAGIYSWASTHALTDSGTLANPITIQGKGNNETNITTTAASTTSAGLHFTTGEHWVVKDLNWTATAARAVWVANVDGIILDNCSINMTSPSTALQSIIIGTAGGELSIKNSTLTRSNIAFHMVEVVEGTTLIMQDNTVSFSALGGGGNASSVQLRTNASSLFIIERNRFVNGGYGIGNVVGTAGPVNANSIIKNNFFNSFWGIVTTIVQGLTVHNNSFYTNREGVYGIAPGNLTDWDIQNNILFTYGTTRSCMQSGSASSLSAPAVMNNNHYYYPNGGIGAGREILGGPDLSFTAWQSALGGGPWETNGQGGNAATFDPLFVDPANGDLRLQAGSPAIDAGTDVGITDDIDGNARPQSGAFDMGAAEFIASETDASLSALEVDDISVPNFSPNTYDYALTVPFGSSPQITLATPSNPASNVVINQTPSIPVDATVLVTAEDGVTQLTYRISFEVLQQYIIQDFEDQFDATAGFINLTGDRNGDGNDNGTSSIVSFPNSEGDDSLVLQFDSESSNGGVDFQSVFFDQNFRFVHFTESNTVEVDVFSDRQFDLLLKLEIGGPDTQVSQPYTTPNQWQTLTFTFLGAHPVDPDGIYQRFAFFPNSDGGNINFDPPQDFTIYLDNIKASSTRDYYIHQNNAWTPQNPVGNSVFTDNILVIDGDPNIDGVVEGGFLQVRPGASLNITSSGILHLAGDIINDGDIIFKSDTSGSGQLEEFNRNISGSGEITTERYIPAGEGPDNGNRAFRYLSSSITTTGSIFDNWQEGGSSSPGFGTHITGIQGLVSDGFDSTTGLDYTQTGNPSMFGFNNDSGQWEAVENTIMGGSTEPTPQIVLQDFDGGTGASGFGAAVAIIEPQVGYGQVARLRSVGSGEAFQGANITLFEPVDLTIDNTMQIQVYSENTISILLKVNQGNAGAPDSATSLTINGQSSWQTLTATFDQSLDNTAPADGVYQNLVIYYLWDSSTDNFITTFPRPVRTFFVNDISGTPVAASPPPSAAILEAGIPYAIMIRGDRTTDLTTNTPQTSNTVLRATGDLKTGPVNNTFTQPDSAVMVGNPYQSVVDLKEVTYTGVLDDEFYVWDPRLGDSGNGAYVTVTTSTVIPDPSGSDANEFLQPGQAVFMLTDNSASHSIAFNENDKATAEPQTEVFSVTSIPYLNMRLYTTARFNSGGQEHDAMGLRFHEQSNIDQFRNAIKFTNSAETMAFEVGDDLASIQHAVLNSDQNLFPVYLASYQHQDYTFWFQLENLPEGTTAFLKDAYLDNSLEIEEGVNSISFQVDASIPQSMNTARFSIEFDVETLSNEAFDTFAFQFYPNPTEDYLTINLGKYQASNTSVKVYDVTGRMLIQSNFTTNESIIQLDLSQLSSGFYLVELEEGNQKFTSKILKK